MTKVFIFSAPSGCGKSTVINALREKYPELNLHFGITATTRPPRGQEKNGVEYYFLTEDEFRKGIENNDFLEYCEVYEGRFYGSLKRVVNTMLDEGKNVVMDLDVVGAQNVKRIMGERCVTVFIKPPSVAALRERLENRGTDTAEVIDQRMARAEFEIGEAKNFDFVVVNDDLRKAVEDTAQIVRKEVENQ